MIVQIAVAELRGADGGASLFLGTTAASST